MKNKKFLPLVILVGVVALLGILLAVLTLHGKAETDTTLPLCDLAADDIDALSYAGNNVEVSLLKGSDGWLLADDPSELPAKSDTPQMTITLGAGEQTVDLTVDQLNSVADVYYVYDESGAAYTVRRSDLATLSKSPRDLYKAQTLTDKTTDDVAAMQVNDLTFTCTDGIWTLADDPDYALTQSSVRKMAGTILEMQTAWTITAPDADSAYGLDAPDVTATLSFTDGTSLTVRFGTASASDDSLCYLASSDAPTLVYEVNADHKSAFAVTKESLHDDTATAETAADTDVVAQYPVGGENDYADSLPD